MKTGQPLAILLGGLLSASSVGCSVMNALAKDERPATEAGDGSTTRMLAIARVFENQGRLAEAEAMYRRALTQNPQNWPIRAQLDLLSKRRQSATAEQDAVDSALAMADAVSNPNSRTERKTARAARSIPASPQMAPPGDPPAAKQKLIAAAKPVSQTGARLPSVTSNTTTNNDLARAAASLQQELNTDTAVTRPADIPTLPGQPPVTLDEPADSEDFLADFPDVFPAESEFLPPADATPEAQAAAETQTEEPSLVLEIESHPAETAAAATATPEEDFAVPFDVAAVKSAESDAVDLPAASVDLPSVSEEPLNAAAANKQRVSAVPVIETIEEQPTIEKLPTIRASESIVATPSIEAIDIVETPEMIKAAETIEALDIFEAAESMEAAAGIETAGTFESLDVFETAESIETAGATQAAGLVEAAGPVEAAGTIEAAGTTGTAVAIEEFEAMQAPSAEVAANLRIAAQRDAQIISLEQLLDVVDSPVDNTELLLCGLRHGDSLETQCLAATLLGDSDPSDSRVREALAEAMVNASNPHLLLAISDSRIELGDCDDATADCLISLLHHDNLRVRIQATSDLRYYAGTNSDKQCATALAKLLHSDQSKVRAIAAITLGDFAGLDEATLSRLRSLASEDQSSEVRDAARAAIERMNRRSTESAQVMIGTPRQR